MNLTLPRSTFASTLLAIALLSCSLPGARKMDGGQNTRTVWVHSDGAGSSRKHAIDDALRNAVTVTVGAIIDSSSTLIDGELIETLQANTTGAVQTYRLLQEEQHQSGWEVSLVAKVDLGHLFYSPSIPTSHLEEVIPLVQKEVSRILDQRTTLRLLLSSAFRDLTDSVVFQVGGKFEIGASVGGLTNLRIPLSYQIDSGNYSAWVKRNIQIFSEAAIAETEESWSGRGGDDFPDDGSLAIYLSSAASWLDHGIGLKNTWGLGEWASRMTIAPVLLDQFSGGALLGLDDKDKKRSDVLALRKEATANGLRAKTIFIADCSDSADGFTVHGYAIDMRTLDTIQLPTAATISFFAQDKLVFTTRLTQIEYSEGYLPQSGFGNYCDITVDDQLSLSNDSIRCVATNFRVSAQGHSFRPDFFIAPAFHFGNYQNSFATSVRGFVDISIPTEHLQMVDSLSVQVGRP